MNEQLTLNAYDGYRAVTYDSPVRESHELYVELRLNGEPKISRLVASFHDNEPGAATQRDLLTLVFRSISRYFNLGGDKEALLSAINNHHYIFDEYELGLPEDWSVLAIADEGDNFQATFINDKDGRCLLWQEDVYLDSGDVIDLLAEVL